MIRRTTAATLVCMASAIFGQSGNTIIPDGTHMALGQYCYTMTTVNNGTTTPVGVTFQSITRVRANGEDVLAIVVHQHMFSGKFDMRDSLLLHRNNLRPIRLDTDRDGAPHVHLEYGDRHVSGWKMEGATKKPIEVDLDGPVWDGNLWGETFAALPLKAGASFTLPAYQYDSGLGVFHVNVIEQQQESTPAGAIQAWRIKAGLGHSEQAEYTVSTRPGLEIAYHAGPFSQRIGGDCREVR